jgi:hypothetical protein
MSNVSYSAPASSIKRGPNLEIEISNMQIMIKIGYLPFRGTMPATVAEDDVGHQADPDKWQSNFP